MRNKLLCSIFILRLSLAEVRYEQDFCQILDINFKDIIVCLHCLRQSKEERLLRCSLCTNAHSFSDFTEGKGGSVQRLECSALVHAETSIPCLVPQLSLLVSVRWNRSIVQ